jgi:hypothetical protein
LSKLTLSYTTNGWKDEVILDDSFIIDDTITYDETSDSITLMNALMESVQRMNTHLLVHESPLPFH